jgi:hypothetical protein
VPTPFWAHKKEPAVGIRGPSKPSITVLQTFSSVQAQAEYLKQATTEGGVTEAIIDSINSGDQFIIALRKGIARSKELAEKTNLSLFC